jgi:hypothetical protein
MLQSLENLRWYQALVAVCALVLVPALTLDLQGVENLTVILFCLGGILIGIGEHACIVSYSRFLDASELPSSIGSGLLSGKIRKWTVPSVLLYAGGLASLGYALFGATSP